MKKICIALLLCLSACLAGAQTQVYGPGTLSYWMPGGFSATAFSFVQNKELYSAYDVPSSVTANYVCVRPTTADNTTTNNYSFSLYSASGGLTLSTGAIHGTVFAPSTTLLCVQLAMTATLKPGRYYASVTTNCSTSCAALGTVALTYFIPLANNQGASTTGGAPNATITPPADSFANGTVAPWFELHK